ncbi:velvet factor-domain-containing protein [Phaeosphaeria sp. MPI-PUGE-AT-0046c]|nr:velvet factor-domain-containing protein [Phaeosphaeria sp. MPI-PUGE-AT-0046c]
MSYPSTTYPMNWGASYPSPAPQTGLQPHSVNVEIVQQPQQALIATNKGKTRKPIDPPAVLRLHVNSTADPSQQWMSNPFVFALCRLVSEDGSELERSNAQPHLIGAQTSSLCRLKDALNQEGGFFVFGDLSATTLGKYKLRFSVFESQGNAGCQLLCEADSDSFEVMSAKKFPGMQESTVLSRIFSDQGVRLRLRKETKGGQEKRRVQEETREEAEVATSPRKRSRYDTNERQDVFDESLNTGIPGHMPRAYTRPPIQYSQQPQTNFAGPAYPSDIGMQHQFRANTMGAQLYQPPYMSTTQSSLYASFQQQARENGLPTFDAGNFHGSGF